ncbi:ATP-binding protein [Kroppenstedtia eburnea]|nr:ATP-binding protein [Kroppenstedtia eburnea]
MIIIELGYQKIEDAAAHFLVQILYPNAMKRDPPFSLPINRSGCMWGEIFVDPVLVTAILDRSLHNSVTVNIKGENYRIKEKKKSGVFQG